MFETKEKAHILAFRPLFFIFLSILTLLLATYFLLYGNYVGCFFMLTCYACCVVYSLTRKRFIICFIALFVSVFCSIYFFICYQEFENSKIDETIEYTIEGRANECNTENSYGFKRVLKNCTISIDDKVIFAGKQIFIFITTSNVDCGDIIRFKTNLENVEFLTSTGMSYEAYDGINYTASIDYSDIESIVKSNLSLKESIKLRIYEILNGNMSQEGSALAYAVLIGDTSYLNYDVRGSFTESGLAHILAVSGLNTTIIFALIILLLKRVGIRYEYKLLIMALCIFFFAYLCDFAPSIVRAGIMGMVMALTILKVKSYDSLNVLSLAGILILILNPIQLFNVGFVLSFSCIFAIALFYSPLYNKITFIPNYTIKGLLCMSIVTTIGTLPCMALYFGKFSILSILTNVILLPLFTFAYVVLFVVTILCLIIPIHFILQGLDYCFLAIIQTTKIFTNVNYDYINILKLSIQGLILSYILLYCFSKKVNIGYYIKYPLCIFLVLCIGVSAFITSSPKIEKNVMVNIEGTNSHLVSINENLLSFNVLGSKQYTNSKEYLVQNNLYDIDYLFVLNDYFISDLEFKNFQKEFDVKNIYIFDYIDNETLSMYYKYFQTDNVYILEDERNYDMQDFSFTYVRESKDSCYIDLYFNNNHFAIHSS